MKILEYNQETVQSVLPVLITLFEQIFDEQFPDDYRSRINSNDTLLALVAYIDDQPAGFKMGYATQDNPSTFYSWLGGTSYEYRNKSVATQLMKHQHKRLKEQGYTAVETKSAAKWNSMMELNFKFGFELKREYMSKKYNMKMFHLHKEL